MTDMAKAQRSENARNAVLDKGQLKSQIRDLNYQLNMKRWKVSESIEALKSYVDEHEADDKLLHGIEKKDNPWIKSGRTCAVL